MNTTGEAWRRWFGALFLLLAFGMVVWGQTILKPRLAGIGFLLYWLLCFLFTVLALLTALLDLFLLRRRSRKEQREMLAATFKETRARLAANKPGKSEDQA